MQSVIEKALNRDPGKRWQSASEMGAALQRLGGSGAVPARDTQTMVIPSRTTVRRKSLLAAVIVTVIAVAAFGLNYYRSVCP